MKQVKLSVHPSDLANIDGQGIEIGKADIQKMPDGSVRVELTFKDPGLIAQLQGNRVSGVITNYEGDDL